MPELPEVETVKNGLAPHMTGQRIAQVELRRAGLRVPFPPGLATGTKDRVIVALARRAKYILITLDDSKIVVLHLGMSGKITILPSLKNYAPEKHDHMIVHLSNGGGFVFNDPRRFGMVYFLEEGGMDAHPAFRNLGPEPLSNGFSGPVLLERLKGRSTPIKIALLDQHVVAGVGNIYASEALYLAGIDPARSSSKITSSMAEKLAAAIRLVLEKAIAAGGSTLKDYRQSDGSLGYFQHSFSVYGREGEPCPASAAGATKKGHFIEKAVQGGRATYFCPKCQK